MIHPAKYSSVILLIAFICFSGCVTDNMRAFQKETAVRADTMSIDNTRDTLIVGAKGTALFFPKETFVFPDGTSPKGKISIQLKECLSFPEMIRENLATMSGNQILETRGMIHVSAFSENKELSIKEGKSFIVHFPKDTAEKNKPMNLYYGNTGKNENVDWNIDTASIIKPAAEILGSTWSNPCVKERYFAFREDTTMNVYKFFDKTFDNKKLTLGNKLLKKKYLFSFTKLKNGNLINRTVTEVEGDIYSSKPVKSQEIDQYVIQFFNTVPSLNPSHCDDAQDETHVTILIGFDYRPDYKNNEEYNNLFNQKYAVFKDQNIKTMNGAELNYYIFSSSKLGWINCDYFWETQAEKIDYILKVYPNSQPNIKLIFKQAKSIMKGTLEGDKYIFKNVPVDNEIKIVAVAFRGSKPLLSVSETTTGKQVFDKFEYKDFTLTDLERQLNNP